MHKLLVNKVPWPFGETVFLSKFLIPMVLVCLLLTQTVAKGGFDPGLVSVEPVSVKAAPNRTVLVGMIRGGPTGPTLHFIPISFRVPIVYYAGSELNLYRFHGQTVMPFPSTRMNIQPGWALAFPADTPGTYWGAPYFSFIRTDFAAINSAIYSGLPMALAQRGALLGVVDAATDDVNSRLFRLRTRTIPAAPAASDKESKPTTPVQRRLEFFASANYSNSDLKPGGWTPDLRANVASASLGAEYNATEHLTLGGALTRVESEHSLQMGDFGDIGDLDINGFAFSGYASWFWHNLYMDALCSIGSFNHELSRDTGDLGHAATAHPESRTQAIQFNTGYNFSVGSLVTGPIFALNYAGCDLDAYDEAGGGGANLHVNGQNFNSLTSRIGWQASYVFSTRIGQITPQLGATWAHEYLNDEESVDVELKKSPHTLETYSQWNGWDGSVVTARFGRFRASAIAVAPVRDWMDLGAGVKWGIGERVLIVADYGIQLGQAERLVQLVSLTGSIKF